MTNASIKAAFERMWQNMIFKMADLYYTKSEGETLSTTLTENYYTKSEVDSYHEILEKYTDGQVAALVGTAPETLNTIEELATAFEENKEVVDALDASITNKQDKVSDTLILVDTVTGKQHKIQIQNGQLVSFPVE